MKTKLLLTAAFATLAASGAQALTITDFQGDATFNAQCNQGTSNQDCELAVGEIRGGNGLASGDWEVGIQNPPGSPTDVKNVTWANGITYTFSLNYSAGTEGLKLSVGGANSSSTILGGLGDMDTLFIRARSVDVDNTIVLANMKLNGNAVGDLPFFGGGSAGANYLKVQDFDFSQSWALVGDVTLDWTGQSIPSGSKLDVNFKLADVEPIPLPAAAWLMIAGLGGLGAVSRAKRRQA